MKKTLKILKKVFLYGGILFVVLIIAAGIMIKIYVTKDFVATQIENNINGRVEIKDISVPLWAALSGISIDGFKIAPKDAQMKKPMEERSPLKNEVLGFKKFNFKIAVGRLITSGGKDFRLKSLLITQPKAHIILYKNGGNNLLSILIKPKTKEDIAAAKVAAAEAKAEKKKGKKTKKKKKIAKAKKKKSKPFSIKSIPTAIKMSKIGIEDGYFTVNVQKIGQKLILSNVDFLIKDISIDPKDLKNKNNVSVYAGLTIKVKESKSKGIKSFKVIFDAEAGLTPFNVKTGYVSQNLALDLTLYKGTFVTGLAIFKSFKEKTEQLKKIGVNLSFLKDTQTLNEDATLGIRFKNGKVTVTKEPAFVTSDMTIRVKKGGYIQTKSKSHKLIAQILLADKHTKTVKAQVDKAIEPAIAEIKKAIAKAKIPGVNLKIDVKDIRNKILEPAIDKETGRLAFEIRSMKKLSNPKVDVIRPKFPSIKSLLKKAMPKIDLKNMLNNKLAEGKKKVSQAINKAKGQAQAKINAAKAEAERKAKAEAKRKAREAAKSALPF